MLDDMIHPTNGHPEYDAWIGGIQKLLEFFHMVDGHHPILSWLITTPDRPGEFLEFQTLHAIDFLQQKLKKGYWTESDRHILNQFRELYYLNKEKKESELFVTCTA